MFEASQTNWVKTHMMDHFSGGFKCRRCGSDKTQYQQKQTRSADEPMTVFIECMACGKTVEGIPCLLNKEITFCPFAPCVVLAPAPPSFPMQPYPSVP